MIVSHAEKADGGEQVTTYCSRLGFLQISLVRKRLEVEGNVKLGIRIPFTPPDKLSVLRCHICQFVCSL